MRKCVVLYNGTNNLNVSVLVKDNLVLNCNGDFNIDRFLHSTNVDELLVIFKPSICNSIPENGYKIGSFKQESSVKVCVISNEDVNNLVDLSRLYKVPKLSIYNYMDILCDKFKDHSKVIVISEWSSNLVALFYLEMGVILDFRKTNLQKLSVTLGKFREKYKCSVLEDMAIYDYFSLCSHIKNIKQIDNSKKAFLSHLYYVLDNKGIDLLSSNNDSVYDINEDDSETSSLINPSYETNEDLSDYEVEEDEDSSEQPSDEKKSGFFGRLFGKKSKAEIFDFEAYDEEYEKSLTREHARYMKQGYSANEYVRMGRSAISVEEKGPFDYIFYAALIILLFCITFSSILGLVYKGRVDLLGSNVEYMNSFHSIKQENIQLAQQAPDSPAVKVAELATLDSSKEINVESIAYTGENYQVNLNSSDPSVTDETLKNSLPSGLQASSVKKSVIDEDAGLYSYAIILIKP